MKGKKINIFSGKSLVVLVSVSTLFLQLISFFTTWDGAKIYFEGIFPFAALCFAIAIQSTAYFFSNSLRNKISILKICALAVAICCSTYFSYIGIYNSVNSPVIYLQKRYAQISNELETIYNTKLEYSKTAVKNVINNANLAITDKYSRLLKEKTTIDNCNAAIEEEKESTVVAMKAPRESDYDSYEDYAAAYSVYVLGSKNGNNAEVQADRDRILSGFGFSSVTEKNEREAQLVAQQNSIVAALGISNNRNSDVLTKASRDYSGLLSMVDRAAMGNAPKEAELETLNRFMNAAKICGNASENEAEILHMINSLSQVAGQKLMKSFTQLEEKSADEMELKAMMDGQIAEALLSIETIPGSEMMPAINEEDYKITDLYLLPINALPDKETKMTACFCLGMAGLVDLLSVLFAVSLKGRKPLWEKKIILASWKEEYASQIFGMLNKNIPKEMALQEFLSSFSPSPDTEADGYMMQAKYGQIENWRNLVALLCQINLAKMINTENSMKEDAIVLLKARFVFWANSEVGKANEVKKEYIYE